MPSKGSSRKQEGSRTSDVQSHIHKHLPRSRSISREERYQGRLYPMARRSVQRSAPDSSSESAYARTLTRLARETETLLSSFGPDTSTSDSSRQEQYSQDDNAQHKDSLVSLPRQIHTTLDPFVTLPNGVTDYERSRLQIYLSLGNFWFGMSDRPRYSPTRATGIPIASHSAVGLQWICILTDETLRFSWGERAPSQQLILQKRRGYHLLNEALRARSTRFEEAILALIIEGLEVSIFGNERSRNLHATATDMILRSRGSLKKALAGLANTEPWFVAAQFSLGKCRFSSRRHLESVKGRWKADLLHILHATKPLCSTVDFPCSDTARPESGERLQAQMIKLVIEIGNTPQSHVAQALQLTLYLELAWTMLQFANSTKMLMNYFHRLDFLTTSMLIGGGPGDSTYDLRGSAVGPALGCARRDVISAWLPAALLDFDTEITAVHINSLKIFKYLESKGRELVLERLSSWLIAGLPESGQALVSEAEMTELEAQIVRTWTSENQNASSW